MKYLMLSFAVAASITTFAAGAEAPNVYAIRGARIVTGAGAPIESGTVVIRRGLIEAVGANVTIPSDADVIEGKGLSVYPGLIDLGNTKAAAQPMPPEPQNVKTTAELERWKRAQILKPQARAADAVKIDDPELRKLAAAGITSALAVPSGDVVAGQSALINVATDGEPPQISNVVDSGRSFVIRTPVALHVSFPDHPRPAGSAYPESLMGVIAFVRQAFLDAQHYHDAPTPTDPSLEALQPAIDRKLPVAFEANQAREILRVLKLARELKLDPIVTGARDAEEVAGDLKAQNVRVVFSLNFPQRPKSLAPDADESLRVLRERATVPTVPAALAKAGVPFAFESAGLGDPKDFVRNAAKAVKAGLAEDAAIRALTIGAASIAGVGDRLGSIEKGKIANLIVTDGDLFAEKTKVTRVFIDGRDMALTAEPAPTAPRRNVG